MPTPPDETLGRCEMSPYYCLPTAYIPCEKDIIYREITRAPEKDIIYREIARNETYPYRSYRECGGGSGTIIELPPIPDAPQTVKINGACYAYYGSSTMQRAPYDDSHYAYYEETYQGCSECNNHGDACEACTQEVYNSLPAQMSYSGNNPQTDVLVCGSLCWRKDNSGNWINECASSVTLYRENGQCRLSTHYASGEDYGCFESHKVTGMVVRLDGANRQWVLTISSNSCTLWNGVKKTGAAPSGIYVRDGGVFTDIPYLTI